MIQATDDDVDLGALADELYAELRRETSTARSIYPEQNEALTARLRRKAKADGYRVSTYLNCNPKTYRSALRGFNGGHYSRGWSLLGANGRAVAPDRRSE